MRYRIEMFLQTLIVGVDQNGEFAGVWKLKHVESVGKTIKFFQANSPLLVVLLYFRTHVDS